MPALAQRFVKIPEPLCRGGGGKKAKKGGQERRRKSEYGPEKGKKGRIWDSVGMYGEIEEDTISSTGVCASL